MDDERARALLQEERVKVQRLLDGASAAGRSDREAVDQDAGSSDAGNSSPARAPTTPSRPSSAIGWRHSTVRRSDWTQGRSVGRSAAVRSFLTTASKPTQRLS